VQQSWKEPRRESPWYWWRFQNFRPVVATDRRQSWIWNMMLILLVVIWTSRTITFLQGYL
jgi:hypothetical protein